MWFSALLTTTLAVITLPSEKPNGPSAKYVPPHLRAKPPTEPDAEPSPAHDASPATVASKPARVDRDRVYEADEVSEIPRCCYIPDRQPFVVGDRVQLLKDINAETSGLSPSGMPIPRRIPRRIVAGEIGTIVDTYNRGSNPYGGPMYIHIVAFGRYGNVLVSDVFGEFLRTRILCRVIRESSTPSLHDTPARQATPSSSIYGEPVRSATVSEEGTQS